jgi:hypothetical protein
MQAQDRRALARAQRAQFDARCWQKDDFRRAMEELMATRKKKKAARVEETKVERLLRDVAAHSHTSKMLLPTKSMLLASGDVEMFTDLILDKFNRIPKLLVTVGGKSAHSCHEVVRTFAKAKALGPFDVIAFLDGHTAGQVKEVEKLLAPGGRVVIEHDARFPAKVSRKLRVEYVYGTRVSVQDLHDNRQSRHEIKRMLEYHDGPVIAALLAHAFPELAMRQLTVLIDAKATTFEVSAPAAPAPRKKGRRAKADGTRRPRPSKEDRRTGASVTAEKARELMKKRRLRKAMDLTAEDREAILKVRRAAFPDRNPKVSDVTFVLRKMDKGEA